MKRLRTTHPPRFLRTDPASPLDPSHHPKSCVEQRALMRHWGDLHPSHRIPTFLECVYYEGDSSATTTARYDT